MSIPRAVVVAWIVCIGLCLSVATALAHDGQNHAEAAAPLAMSASSEAVAAPATTPGECASGGYVVDGYALDTCLGHSFMVGGVEKSVSIWYSTVVSPVQRQSEGNITLNHHINNATEAQRVADWFEDAWVRYNSDSGGHHLYDNGCDNNVDVRMEDGVGWSGIAYWGAPGDCKIGIDSPMVRGGGGQWTVYHEAQHYFQYSYNAGCYLGSIQPGYSGNSEFVEGYADLGADSVDAALDATGYSGNGYANLTSMYDKSYGNRFNKYFVEQLGSLGSPTDPWHNMNALYEHYEACDVADDLYVLDTLVPSLGGISEERLFLNFFAANWAKDWADPATQEDIIYYDDDTGAYGQPTMTTVDVSSGSFSVSESTPDDWAARYYQITPPATGCPFIEMEVDGAAGAKLGINFMAAKTTAPTKVLRSAWIGENYVRTFAGVSAHNRLVTVVNSFQNNYNYTFNATCVTPALQIIEPRQVNPAFVGAPDAPIAFLARWRVVNNGAGVRGLLLDDFVFDVEGAAPTVAAGSFQAVGDEYWAVLIPPVKPVGTTFADLEITMADDASVTDIEDNALLYVDPGNSDIALVFDASGSMDFEDTIGEGKRVEMARKAGLVIADLLRPEDRILVTDFSAFDNPPGCGNNNQDCALDLRTLLPRRDVSDPPAGDIADTKTAIGAVTAREWTPIGPAINDGMLKLLALPSNDNPKHMFLLSDGEENVKPLYADIRQSVIDSGVVVNTIGFGPEAPGNMLAQVATDTGGIYRPVPTDTSGASAASVASADELAAMGMPTLIAQAMAAPVPPGHLGLADVYDYFDTEAQDATRVIRMNYNLNAEECTFHTPLEVEVDKSATEMRFVIAGKHSDDGADGYYRRVQVMPPGADPDRGWIDISPPQTNPPPPADWDIRHSLYDDVLIVPNPAEGVWKFRSCYFVDIIGVAEAAPQSPDAPQLLPANVMLAVSLQSTFQTEGFFQGLTANQGEAGDVVHILAMLMSKAGTAKPNLVVGLVEHPGGSNLLQLHDDGAHGDGSAGDGIYGVPFGNTGLGGGYSVRILAQFEDPNRAGINLLREWNGGFWIKGPRPKPTGEQDPEDTDGDGMPDPWEERCGLVVGQNDAGGDLDKDGLPNIDELKHGTSPCDPDTDNGGESDGSEVRHGRDPLNPRDDKVVVIGPWTVRPMNGFILVSWTKPLSYTNMILHISTDVDDLGRRIDMGTGGGTGDHKVEGLTNDTTYYVRLQGEVVEGPDTFQGPPSQPQAVTPKADPDAPAGAVLVEEGKETTDSKQVTLYVSSTDIPLLGAAQGANAHQTDIYSALFNVAAGDVQMRFSNNADMSNASPYEPLAETKPWELACEVGDTCRVYAQFKDGAGNESLIIFDDIVLVEAPEPTGLKSFLPLIKND